MKTLIAVLLLILLVSIPASAQKEVSLRGLTSGTSWVGYAYVNSQSDTSNAITLGGKYAVGGLVWKANDSVSVILNYQPSYDGVTFGTKVAIGSAHTVTGAITSSAPDQFAWQIPAIAMLYPKIRFVIDYQSSGCGVTSPASSAKVVLTP